MSETHENALEPWQKKGSAHDLTLFEWPAFVAPEVLWLQELLLRVIRPFISFISLERRTLCGVCA